MMNQTNPSIKCSVNSCTYHKDQRCTLNEIQVGCCQNSVCDCQETLGRVAEASQRDNIVKETGRAPALPVS